MNCSNNGFNHGQSLVYLDKIFYDSGEKASPIMTALTTTPETFTQQFAVSSSSCSQSYPGHMNQCGCNCCCDLTIGPGTIFNVDSAFVVVHSYDLTVPDLLTAADVTVDGLPITNITASGGQYEGDISGIISEITKCQCKPPCSNQCPGNFVMITADGPWNLLATIVVEGTVTTGSTSCPFKLCFAPFEGEPISVVGTSTFAFCNVNIPCQKNNAVPSLILSFDACASLLNPSLTVGGTTETPVITLAGSLIVTPQIQLRTVRPTLFNLNAYEIEAPCDDVGQCNPCNAYESECFDITDSCCCGNDSVQISDTSPTTVSACQCCETNGYGYF